MVSDETPSEVFIIEGIGRRGTDGSNIEEGLEGKRIKEILKMYGKSPILEEALSIAELRSAIDSFDLTGYKYLHISAHGDGEGLQFGRESISYRDFADILSNKLSRKRLFVSSCELGNERFVDEIERTNSRVLSVMAPIDTVHPRESLLLWTVFYPVMTEADRDTMKSENIRHNIQKLFNLFRIKFMFCWRIKGKEELERRKFVAETEIQEI